MIASSSGAWLRCTPMSSMRATPACSSDQWALRRASRSQSASWGSVARMTSVAPGRGACRAGPVQLRLGGRAARVRFDHEHRPGVLRQAHVERRVHGPDREPVHQLQGHRHDARHG